MEISVIHGDVACVYSWYEDYAAFKKKLPKIPLLLACLAGTQVDKYSQTLLADGWREVGWYPSCHQSLDTGAKVSLMCKEQKVAPVKEMPKIISYAGYEYKVSPFNEYVPLGCSVMSYETRVKQTIFQDQHRVMGLHRRTTKTRQVYFGNWIRFAKTPLATYWFWGLAPNEKDRFKLEPKE